MENSQLKYDESISSVRIFLNALGYSLGDEFNWDKIRNKDMKDVGRICLDGDKLIIKIKDKYICLTGECNIRKSLDYNIHKIKYEIKIKKTSKVNNIRGNLLLTAKDSLNKKCTCSASMVCTSPSMGNIDIKIAGDGNLLEIIFNSPDYSEKISITVYRNGSIKHGITRKQFNDKSNKIDYRLFSGVFNSQQFSVNVDKLHIILLETLGDKIIQQKENYVDKASDPSGLLMQKGSLMRRLDHTMFDRIQQTRGLLSIGNTGILDNLLNICCEDLSNEELQMLFGINKNTSIYQDGANNLSEAYFNDRKLDLSKAKKRLR